MSATGGAASASRLRQRAMTILWPAFLMAGVLETLVFGLVDPRSLRWFGGAALELPAPAVYTLAFFVFWIVIAVAALLSQMLELSADEVNRPGGADGTRQLNSADPGPPRVG
jgi:hypothetical protein